MSRCELERACRE